ncbi:MAG: c-type cytochrome [Acidobacteriaceae bacterium]
MGKGLFPGFIVGILVLPLAALAYFQFGHPPVAVADTPFPFEARIVHVPLYARIDREMPKTPPFGIDEDVFESGAHIYHAQCSACHGVPGHDSDFAKHMYPRAPQLWVKHHRGNVVGVSDDPPGATYWKVANGIRLTGMPSYNHVLTDTQMWQVSLLLAHANEQLPDPVMKILQQPLQ